MKIRLFRNVLGILRRFYEIWSWYDGVFLNDTAFAIRYCVR